MNARLLSRLGLSCSGMLCSFASALMPHAMDVTETWMPCSIGPTGSTWTGNSQAFWRHHPPPPRPARCVTARRKVWVCSKFQMLEDLAAMLQPRPLQRRDRRTGTAQPGNQMGVLLSSGVGMHFQWPVLGRLGTKCHRKALQALTAGHQHREAILPARGLTLHLRDEEAPVVRARH